MKNRISLFIYGHEVQAVNTSSFTEPSYGAGHWTVKAVELGTGELRSWIANSVQDVPAIGTTVVFEQVDR